MRIIVVSDTHGSPEKLLDVVRHAGKTDMLLHLGDGLRDCSILEGTYGGEIYMVRGNCDVAPYDVYERFIPLDGAAIFMTHGHLFDVKNTLSKLWAKGKEVGADIICFGHTHIPLLDKQGMITLLNPGSLRHGKTYGLIEIQNGKPEIAIRTLRQV
jgi:putative phosphoesterase